jgi:hypothetical protein
MIGAFNAARGDFLKCFIDELTIAPGKLSSMFVPHSKYFTVTRHERSQIEFGTNARKPKVCTKICW